jgi:leucyl aminopeptidase (aminopeptidase T)
VPTDTLRYAIAAVAVQSREDDMWFHPLASRAGRALKAALDGAREARVTAPGGTDVTFTIGKASCTSTTASLPRKMRRARY